MSSDKSDIFTVGHSTHNLSTFLELTSKYRIQVIADVRSQPFSRHFPHFNRQSLQRALKEQSQRYVFLGKELGGRPEREEYFTNGVADYELMSKDSDYLDGIQRILTGAESYRIALMCSEHNPLDCHRCLLVGRTLSEYGLRIGHILGDGTCRDQQSIEETLLRMSSGPCDDLFVARDVQLSKAYRERANRVAFIIQDNSRLEAEIPSTLEVGN